MQGCQRLGTAHRRGGERQAGAHHPLDVLDLAEFQQPRAELLHQRHRQADIMGDQPQLPLEQQMVAHRLEQSVALARRLRLELGRRRAAEQAGDFFQQVRFGRRGLAAERQLGAEIALGHRLNHQRHHLGQGAAAGQGFVLAGDGLVFRAAQHLGEGVGMVAEGAEAALRHLRTVENDVEGFGVGIGREAGDERPQRVDHRPPKGRVDLIHRRNLRHIGHRGPPREAMTVL